MVKDDKKVESKEELATELLKVRSEIQWREREMEELIKEDPLSYSVVIIPLVFVIPFCAWFGKEVGFIIAIVPSTILIVILQKRFWKSKDYKKIQKAKRELEELRKRKTELEKKLDNLESKN